MITLSDEVLMKKHLQIEKKYYITRRLNRRNRKMNESEHSVTVTSPGYVWLGTSIEQREPTVLSVLVGKDIPESQEPVKNGDLTPMIEACREMDIVALFFEEGDKGWTDVPTEKFGEGPYMVSDMLAFNFFYAIRPCKDNDEQRNFLQAIGLAINDQFVGC